MTNMKRFSPLSYEILNDRIRELGNGVVVVGVS